MLLLSKPLVGIGMIPDDPDLLQAICNESDESECLKKDTYIRMKKDTYPLFKTITALLWQLFISNIYPH
jgi:hypothetical protein